MLYDLYEWQRWAVAPALDVVDWSTQPARTWLPVQLAMQDWVLRLAQAGEPVGMSFGDFVRADAGGPLDATSSDLNAFTKLWRLRGASGQGAPVVFVPPWSGYVAGVASPLVARLLRHRPVLAIDWVDARLVPQSAGRFGLAEQIATVEAVVRAAGPGAVLVGLSQSVTVAIAGAALAATRGAKPAALVLLAGPVDTREGLHPVSTLLRFQPQSALEYQCISAVPDRFPGAARRVYPGLLQLWAYALGNPQLYVQSNVGLFLELATGQSGFHTREHRDLHSLADVPAELFLETVEAVYREHQLVSGRLRLDSRRVDMDALGGVQLLTVEMTADDLVGAGHTHAAVDHLPHNGARRVTVEGGLHHEVFTGERFYTAVAPHLDEFLQAA